MPDYHLFLYYDLISSTFLTSMPYCPSNPSIGHTFLPTNTQVKKPATFLPANIQATSDASRKTVALRYDKRPLPIRQGALTNFIMLFQLRAKVFSLQCFTGSKDFLFPSMPRGLLIIHQIGVPCGSRRRCAVRSPYINAK